MISNGTIELGTGDDDLREGSQVWVRIYVQGSAAPYFVQEIADGRRFPDRTLFSAAWSVATPIEVEDIERVEIAFIPDQRAGLHDDDWELRSLTFAVHGPSGSRELYRNDAVRMKFEGVGAWDTGPLPTYEPRRGGLSLRAALGGVIDLSRGVVGSLGGTAPLVLPSTGSLRALGEMLHWPRYFVETDPFPTGEMHEWHDQPDDGFQGMCVHDGRFFVIAQQQIRVARLDDDLVDGPPGVAVFREPDRYLDPPRDQASSERHLGAASFWNDTLFVPYESPSGVFALHWDGSGFDRVQFALLDPPIPATPWCAVNPLTGLLYTSEFRSTDAAYPGPLVLHVHRPRFDGGFRLEWLGAVEIPDRDRSDHQAVPLLRGLQGGMFTPRGHLYLVADTKNPSWMVGIDLARRAIMIQNRLSGWNHLEVEQVFHFDMTDRPVAGMSGQLHVVQAVNGIHADASGNNDLDLRHFAVVDAADRPLV